PQLQLGLQFVTFDTEHSFCVLLSIIFQHRADCLKRVSFEPIVHVNVRLPSRLVSLSFDNHPCASLTCFFVHFLCFIVRLKCFHSVFVFPSGFQEESRRDQFRVCSAAG